MVKEFKSVKRDGTVIRVLQDEDGKLYAYDTAERWNGEYWKGWLSDEYGYSIENWEYHIRPIYKGIGEQNEDGNFEAYEIVDYEIEQ